MTKMGNDNQLNRRKFIKNISIGTGIVAAGFSEPLGFSVANLTNSNRHATKTLVSYRFTMISKNV